jgi:quinohemoprotein ethanol dehydrogenase
MPSVGRIRPDRRTTQSPRPIRRGLGWMLLVLLACSPAQEQGANASGSPPKEQGANASGSPPKEQGANASGSPPKEQGAKTSGSPPKEQGAKATSETSTPGIQTGVSADWPLHGLTTSEQRFSPLRQIDRTSVSRLGLAWSYDTLSHRGLEATPIVVDGVLYATSTWSVVFALDARTGRELWRHDPAVPRWKARHACCDVVNRGVAVEAGRVFAATLDGRLQALDAASGALLWSVRTTPLAEPYTITGAPRIAAGLVVIGNGGAEYGVRGYVSAYDARTGELVWRFHTVPASADGPHENPALERAAETWPADALWASGLGGTVWDSMVWDPELDLLYVGTGNASVYDRRHRSPGGGDNLYLASILALRPRTGELVWHYQTTPGDHWDYTATQPMILADLVWQGEPRRVLMQAPKNGFFYVLDRETGELLSAEKFVHASWASHVDLETGRPVERPQARWSEQARRVSPSPPGAHNWHPMSFHPGLGLVYLPVTESVYDYHPDPAFRYRPGRWNTSEDFTALHEALEDFSDLRFLACGRSRLVAWDPTNGEPAWTVDHDGGLPGGTLATAGGLVFQGHGGGRFSAFDAGDGRPLWSVDVGVDVIAPPVTYAIEGEQYVAVLAGAGGSHGGHATQLDHDNAGRLLAFKLDARTPMPPVERRSSVSPRVPPLDAPTEVIDRGRAVYAHHCFMCHGMGVVSSGLVPDLREAGPTTHDQWDAIVRGGLRTPGGMPSFADQLSAEEAEAVRAYVLERAWHRPSAVSRALSLFVEHACLPASWLTD